MPSIQRSFKRTSGYRDAKLIVIATEGENTEPVYFGGLIEEYHHPSIHVEILERSVTASAPAHVQRELDKFNREYRLVDGDELWMVVDRDRWTEAHLASVAQRCIQKSYNLAVSNPCFELWLLLHIEDPSLANIQPLSCTQISDRIREILGTYNKSNLDITAFIPTVASAIERARIFDTNPGDRWPQQAGTSVYRLAAKIIAS
jgi:hypothetical protein